MIESQQPVEPVAPLRRASSDSNIPKVTVQSPTTEDDSVINKKDTTESKEKKVKQHDQGPSVKKQSHSDAGMSCLLR